MSDEDIFREVWERSASDPACLHTLVNGGVWRGAYAPPMPLRPRYRSLDDTLSYKIINYRAKRLRELDGWAIEASWEGSGRWSEIARGRME